MNSIQRTLATTRALIAELPLGHYLLSSIVCLVLILLHFYEVGDSNTSTESLISADYFNLGRANALAFILGTAIFSSAILSIDFITREFKEQHRALRFLSLPISQLERGLVMVAINWIFIPLITILPPFLLLSVISLAGGDSILFPSPEYLLPAIPASGLVIILLSSLWLLPCIALPKRGGIAFLCLMGLLGVYLLLTRGDSLGAIKIPQALSAFNEQQVVGLGVRDVLTESVPPDHFYYNLPDDYWGVATLLAVVAILSLFTAAVVALNRKTA